jgi:hypothetical protein
MSRRQKMDEKEAREILGEIARSGMPRAEFCRRRGLNAGTLSWWKHQLKVRDRRLGEDGCRTRGRPDPLSSSSEGRRPGCSGSPLHLVELTVKKSLPSSIGHCLEVVLAGGRIIRVPAQFDGETLGRLVEVLEGGSC